jgi:hypothetical protein
MRVKSHVGSNRFLKAETLGPNKAVRVEILRVELEKMAGKDERQIEKPVMYFTGHTLGLVLNVENVNTLTELFGTDESELWLGKQIELYTTNVRVGAKSVLGIRVRAAVTSTGQQPPRRELTEEPRNNGPMHAADIRW